MPTSGLKHEAVSADRNLTLGGGLSPGKSTFVKEAFDGGKMTAAHTTSNLYELSGNPDSGAVLDEELERLELFQSVKCSLFEPILTLLLVLARTRAPSPSPPHPIPWTVRSQCTGTCRCRGAHGCARAANARHRHLVVPTKSTAPSTEQSVNTFEPTSAPMTSMARLKRVFDIDITHCPRCGGKLQLIGVVTEPPHHSHVSSSISKYTRVISMCPGRHRCYSPAETTTPTPHFTP